MGFYEHVVVLDAASRSLIIEIPQNNEFLVVICLCKKGIEIKISNIRVNWKKEENVCLKTLKIHNYSLK